MGGKSSSSSSSSTTTVQTDERIAATDQANVIKIDGSNNQLTDHEAIAKAGELALETINLAGQVAIASVTQNKATTDTLSETTDRVLTFADEQARDEASRTLQDYLPYLLAGVSVLALTGNLKLGA